VTKREISDDPSFTHYVIERGYVVSEAKDVKPCECGCGNYFAFVRLFGMGQFAEYGMAEKRNLINKKELKKYKR
jgi:hypothetical protein